MCDEAGINIFDYIAEVSPYSLSMKGFDDCIMGTCELFDHQIVIAYDKKKVIDRIRESKMGIEEAEEYFNTYMLRDDKDGFAPVFVTVLT